MFRFLKIVGKRFFHVFGFCFRKIFGIFVGLNIKSMNKGKKKDLKELARYEVSYRPSQCVTFNSYRKDDRKILSNFYPCAITYDGKQFNSTEQLFVYRTLNMWGDDVDDVIADVMDCQNGKEVKNCKSWRKAEQTIDKKMVAKIGHEQFYIEKWRLLYQCICEKFKHCKEFREVLQKYKDKHFVEDAFWGDNFYGALFEDGKYKGVNACGRAIEKVCRVLGK